MKRKLVNEDLIKIQKLLNQLHINGKQVTFDFIELTVEASVEPPGAGENGELLSEGLELQTEEDILAEILAKSEVPEQTGLRYLQRFWEYFETDRDQIVFTLYNMKLLQSIDQLFSRGLAPDEVKKILEDGDDLFSLAAQSAAQPSEQPSDQFSDQSIKLTREYFDSEDPLFEFGDEENERSKTDWVGKASKWALVALGVLILLAIGSYQVGLLRPIGLYPDARNGFEKASEERAGEKGEQERDSQQEKIEEEHGGEETEAPVIVPILTPEEITVNVLNGSGKSGVAGRFADKLEQLGYQVMDVDNADHFNYSRSQVINRLEGDEVWEVLELIPQAELLSEASGKKETMITVIIGSDYGD